MFNTRKVQQQITAYSSKQVIERMQSRYNTLLYVKMFPFMNDIDK